MKIEEAIRLLETITKKKVVLREDAKDTQRVQDIKTKSDGDNYKATSLAKQMADKITTSAKAYERYKAALEIFGQDSRVADVFLKRANELGHTDATAIVKDKEEVERVKQEEEKKRKVDAIMPEAQKLAAKIKSRVPGASLSISTSCDYPYWSGTGLFISIDGNLEGANYSGYTSGGPSHVTGYRKEYLGKDLYSIAGIVGRAGYGLYKDHRNYFVKIPFKRV